MSIDKTIQTIEIKGKKMSTITKRAPVKLQKATGYTGNPFNEAETKKYFSKYNMEPLIQDNRMIGMKINYQLLEGKPAKEKARASSGSGPAINYQF